MTYRYRAPAAPVPARDMVLRCRACAHVQHQECAGRAAGCRCGQCWGRQMLSEARRPYRTPGTSFPAVYQALGNVIALEAQRSIRRRKIRAAEPRFNAYCEAPGCHQAVWSTPYGRKKRYCSPSCKACAYRARRRERAVPQP